MPIVLSCFRNLAVFALAYNRYNQLVILSKIVVALNKVGSIYGDYLT